jgi:LmbE family N-acetylglucosaminyl deacetylase
VADELVSGRSCLIVAPHPDDETIGAGIWMDRHSDWDITLLHVTDGSPRDGGDARSAGLSSRRAYAEARRRELHEALGMLAPGRRRCRVLSYVDKESILHVEEIITRTAALIEKLRPATVLSPAYEGGHPDHDATALALALARTRVSYRFRHQEYTLYHAGRDGEMTSGEFLQSDPTAAEVLRLTEAEQRKKRKMMAAFTTQAGILSRFEVGEEHFRDAPAYDFTRAPHEGRLLYESWNIGVTGEEWRRLARTVL